MYENWLKILQANKTPAAIVLRFGPVRARSVAKSLVFCTSCTSVDLSHAALTDLSGCFLSRCLKHNTALKHVNLASNALGVRTAAELGEALRKNTTLTSLFLDSNPLTLSEGSGAADLSGLRNLCDGLESNGTLRNLNLFRTNLGDAGVKVLVDSLRVNRTLIHCDIGASGATEETNRRVFALLDRNLSQFGEEKEHAAEEKENDAASQRAAEEVAAKEQWQRDRHQFMEVRARALGRL